MRRYLLGQLSEADEEQVELRLLTDPAFNEEIDIIVDEIAIRYAGGGFEGEEKQQVEHHFLLAPERRQKVQIMAELLHHAAVTRGEKEVTLPTPAVVNSDSGLFARARRFWNSQTPAFRFATTVATLVIVVGVVLLARSGRPTTSNYASLILTSSDAERGPGEQNEVKSIRLQPGTDELQIQLLLPAQQTQPKSYRVEFAPPAVPRNATVVSHDTQSVAVTIPATELKPDRYAIRLFAIYEGGREERIRGSYAFRVE